MAMHLFLCIYYVQFELCEKSENNFLRCWYVGIFGTRNIEIVFDLKRQLEIIAQEILTKHKVYIFRYGVVKVT